jgi:hypothetical protein
MSATIHYIEHERPHVLVDASDCVHQIPHALIRSVIRGEKPSSILTEPVLRRVLEEWLEKTI